MQTTVPERTTLAFLRFPLDRNVLEALRTTGPLTVPQLALTLRTEETAVTAALTRLWGRRLVRRAPRARDRRTWSAIAAVAGVAEAKRTVAAADELLQRLSAELAAANQRSTHTVPRHPEQPRFRFAFDTP